MAVSKLKCNSGLMNGSWGYRSGCEHTFEDLEWRMKCMGSARSAVEAVGDGIEFVLTVDREVSTLGQILIWSPKSGRHKVDNQPCGGSDEIRTESEVHGGVSRGGGRAGDSGPAWIARGCAESGDVGQDAGELGGQCA